MIVEANHIGDLYILDTNCDNNSRLELFQRKITSSLMIKIFFDTWHNILGHLSSNVLKVLCDQPSLNTYFVDYKTSCHIYHFFKTTKITFSSHNQLSNQPF